VTFQSPFTYSARYPANAQQPNSARQPITYQARQPIYLPPPPGGGGFGCFPAGSMVWLADGSHVAIETIEVGQNVWTWNEELNTLEINAVEYCMKPRVISVWDIHLSDGRVLQTSDDHPIKIAGVEGWGALNPELTVERHEWLSNDMTHTLEVGTRIFTMTDAVLYGKESEEVVIEKIEENDEMVVYNLSAIANTGTFFVNGVLVHNYYNPIYSQYEFNQNKDPLDPGFGFLPK
jgi:hypothetical protein